MTLQAANAIIERASIEVDNQIYQIAITKIPKIGAKNAKKLVAHFGHPRYIFHASRKELSAIFGIGDQRINEIKSSKALEIAHQELEYNQANGIRSVFFQDKDYPQRLKEIEDGPLVIYVKGNAGLNPERMISIVGTRKPCPFGLRLCEQLIDQLKEYNPTIVSGLAFGVDACAHKSALNHGLPTLGIVAHGLADIYPVRHRTLARKMTEQGAVISEFTHNITAEREFFPMRNRIIAGLADALIVVQTAKKGGSMISADLANAYNREVFTFPGRVGEPLAAGGNLLIKQNRAHLIESGADLAFELGWDQAKPLLQKELFADLSDTEMKVVEILKDGQSHSLDRLVQLTELAQHVMPSILLQLEFKGLVLAHPGKRFSLL